MIQRERERDEEKRKRGLVLLSSERARATDDVIDVMLNTRKIIISLFIHV